MSDTLQNEFELLEERTLGLGSCVRLTLMLFHKRRTDVTSWTWRTLRLLAERSSKGGKQLVAPQGIGRAAAVVSERGMHTTSVVSGTNSLVNSH